MRWTARWRVCTLKGSDASPFTGATSDAAGRPFGVMLHRVERGDGHSPHSTDERPRGRELPRSFLFADDTFCLCPPLSWSAFPDTLTRESSHPTACVEFS